MKKFKKKLKFLDKILVAYSKKNFFLVFEIFYILDLKLKFFSRENKRSLLF